MFSLPSDYVKKPTPLFQHECCAQLEAILVE